MGSLTATVTARNLRLGFCASGVAWPVFTDRNGCGNGNRKRICTFHCSLYTFSSRYYKTISSSSSSLCKLSVANSAPGVASSEELKESVSASSEQTIQVASTTRSSLNSLMEVVADDLQMLNDNLRSVVGAGNPMLISAADQIFSAGGKRMRPALVFLVSRATATMAGLKDLTPEHRRLAEIIEMIHTASLIHDDVLDESEVRRGRKTIHQLYGTRIAVLAGDFLFAQSSWYLANLENLEVIKLISQVIKDFASGEIKQASSLFDCNMSMEEYMEKSFYKTASLVAASTRSAAIFSGVSREVCEAMYEYGRNLGLAFQVVDDILDLTQSTTQLGKPAGSDLAKGNLTAPVLYALRPQKMQKKEDEDEDAQELRRIIDSEFMEEGSLERAVQLVQCGQGIRQARLLAQRCAGEALRSLRMLPPSPAAASLRDLVHYVLHRVN